MGKRRVLAGKRSFSAIPRIVVLPPVSVSIEEGKEIGLGIKPHPAVKHRPKRMQFTGGEHRRDDIFPRLERNKAYRLRITRPMHARVIERDVPRQRSMVMLYVSRHVASQNRQRQGEHSED